jgi:hypothetical protein
MGNIPFKKEYLMEITNALAALQTDVTRTQSLVQTVSEGLLAVDQGCTALYEFAMNEKTRSDALRERVEKLENEKNNPR